MIALRLAVRNLLRNRWRSALTLGGVAVAVALMVWTLAFYEGWIGMMVRGATAVETGQIQVQSAAYARDGRIYQSLEVDEALLEAITSVPGVRAAAPRIVASGLVGNEQRSRVARIFGVDPEREAAVTPVAEAVQEGRWLRAPEPEGPGDATRPPGSPAEVVLGADLARQLRVSPGDELVVFLEAADGSLGNDLLEVVGTVRTGNDALDRMGAWLTLEEARFVTALEGEANAVVIGIESLPEARAVADSVAAALAGVLGPDRVRLGAPPDGVADDEIPDGLVSVRPWQEMLPTLDQMISVMRSSYWIMYLIVYLVAAVGILNTQRMSALERKREFGVLLAVGVRPRRMFRILQVETLTLGTGGALLGVALGSALSWYHATAGFDLTLLTDQAAFTFMGVAFRERIYFDMGVASALQPFVVMLGVALLSGLWPALTAARIDPAPAIAGRVG